MDPLMARSALYALALHAPILGGFYVMETGGQPMPSPAISIEIESLAPSPPPQVRAQKQAPSTHRQRPEKITHTPKKIPGDSVLPAQPLRILKRVEPAYPESAHPATGTAHIALRVETNGTVTTASVAQSSGNQDLDTAAQKAVTQWRFHPAPHPITAVVPVRFRLCD